MDGSFFRVLADPNARSRWFLGEPLDKKAKPIDSRAFTQGIRYDGPKPASVPIDCPGKVVGFNLAAFDMPVVSESIVQIVKQYASDSVQPFPIVIDSNIRNFLILNVTSKLHCIDEDRSEIMKWTPSDGRPEKIGQYKMITRIRVDSVACGHHHVFRIAGWEIALIVSKQLRDAIVTIPDVGIVFDPV